jgi:hypothetical protein
VQAEEIVNVAVGSQGEYGKNLAARISETTIGNIRVINNVCLSCALPEGKFLLRL